jgi:hypothetical protein
MNDARFDDIADAKIQEVAEERRKQRSLRRAAAMNAIQLARSHAERNGGDFSPEESDILVAIMDLLDKVATP